MSSDLSKVDLLTRREIEARIAAPLIAAFMKEFGEEKTLQIAGEVIKSLAREGGAQLAEMVGGNSLADFRKATEAFSAGGAHDTEVVQEDKDAFKMNITRCEYVDIYKDIGYPELGFLLSCGRDYALVEGFNPDMELERNKTIMEGDDLCDFCFKMKG